MRGATLAWCGLVLATAAAADEYQTAIGPFRVQLLSVHRQRDLMLVRGPWVWVDELGAQHPIDRKTPKTRATDGPSFYARLRVLTEPPTPFRLDGPATLAEAVDDLDQSLEAAPEDTPAATRPGVPQRGAFTAVDLRLPLSLPDQPGKTIKRLRGSIPVVVSVRSTEPIAAIPLSGAKGRTVAAGDVVVNVLDVTTDPGRRTVVVLSARLKEAKADLRDPDARNRMARRLIDVARQQIDVVDDQTRSLPVLPSTAVRRDEVRITLRSAPDDEHGTPDRLRVFGLSHETREVPFDFRGVPLP